ncbi:GTP cyclohydrolase MptA [Archaeoglobus sulfaticallidus PM70-1]|uniref:GTP cyclohydrolase MptA n=1 Tax=Archaeoglobus sulfaticallidus PM70-1 TaxID=387631 RepID=N0BC69_9EURY|nr:GTP cyclohydrolase MptA [Archaeoglobus sulfaticallidus]AGK60578.1 GTP cyclohydrolase MptA [Archaeoglobus sulfaticallidus PM70-1]
MLPDVQLLEPDVPIGLSRVGATGVKKLVQVERDGKRPIILISNFDVFVDLPSTRKGVNLSRNFEAVDEVIENLTATPVKTVEELTIKMADALLEKHEYATKAEVKMVSELILRKRTPVTHQKTQEVVKIFCDAVKWKDGNQRILVGVEVTGITSCPCAQELVKAKYAEVLKNSFSDDEISKIMQIIPFPSHNQRGRARIKMEVKDGFSPSIDELIEVARSSMSYEIYEILKREDELAVVENVHKNPRFVEDSVRIMAKKTVEKFVNAPDDILVIFRQENEESIHQHNVVAERVATLGELRKELNNEGKF